MIARADLMTWTTGSHGSTYGGNPVALAAMMETIALLEEGLIENAGQRGEQGLARAAAPRRALPRASSATCAARA